MTSNDNYEKPSKNQQWHERGCHPIATRQMTRAEIDDFRLKLVASYDCADSDISYYFQKITDEDDSDRDDCLWLKYRMKRIKAGKPVNEDIFSLKLPIPDDVREKADQLRRENAMKQRQNNMVPTPNNALAIAEQTKTKLKKPIRNIKR